MIRTQVQLLAVCEPMIQKQELVEGKVDSFKMPAFWEDGGPHPQRLPSPFLEWSRGFIGTQENAIQREKGVSQVTP